MPQKDKLGEAVSALLRATYGEVDYHIEEDCNPAIHRSQMRDFDRVAQRYGFRNLRHLSDEVARRTSSRWVWFNLPTPCDDLD